MNADLQDILSQVDELKDALSALRPLPTEAIAKIQQAFDIEYTYESNRIEGNTLTLQETALVVNEGMTIAGKSMREHLETVNHAEAIEFIKEIAAGQMEISEKIIKDIHALVLRGIDRQNAGIYRSVPVMISGSRHIPPQPYLVAVQMEMFVEKYRKMESEGTHAVLIAAFLHDELIKIHPFIDGNGRTSRLLMNLYLLSKGYVIANIKGSYEDRMRYYTSLEKAHTENEPDDFYKLVAETEKEALQKYLNVLK
jgi:Fic family protein